jgi:hypothetical protein|tara:strand:+ start:15640 stop:15900 length:261 start_codon:yes stop_codon:yes gene_type:complete
MNKENLGNQVSVKVGAVVVGVHTVEPACMIVLESEQERAILVSNKYVEEQLDPKTIINDHDMLGKALADTKNWIMLEGVDNPFEEA